MQAIGSAYVHKSLIPILAILAGAAAIAAAILLDVLRLSGAGFGANQASLALGGLTLMLAGLTSIAPPERRPLGEWLLIAIAAISLALVSDLLFTTQSIPLPAKAWVFAALLSAVTLVRASAALQPGEGVLSWLQSLTGVRESVTRFATLLVQLGLLVLLIREFELENQAFYHSIMLLIFSGFFIHALLPQRYRLPFFLFLSLVAIVGILGVGGVWLIGIGLALIAIAHLPFPAIVRVGLLLLVALGLALFRADLLSGPVPPAVWPILGSIFMFRMIIYLYDLKHSKRPGNIWRTLSYFFLLPNVVFPFFPVVDYDTFGRTYYNDDRFRIYQKGVSWIFRGVIQLILYRVVNYYLLIAPADVTNVGELVQFAITNFALYFRITGQFHLIIGLLHLFGFNLPETNHRYFLSSSFTDLWRRANIYWKDFMQKVFYFPAYFKLSKHGATAALLVSAVFVFVITWFLHAYQWFWLRGTFLFTAVDISFWTILGVLVIANMYYESKRGRRRSLTPRTWSTREIGVQALRVAGTFSTIAILWTLWSSESIGDWLRLWSVGFQSFASVAGLVLAFLAIAVVLGAVIWFEKRGLESSILKLTQSTPSRTAATYSAVILAIFLLGNQAVYSRFGGKAQEVMADLTVARLSDRDAELLLRGYYEDLVGVDRFNADLWEAYSKRPANWPTLHDTEAARFTSDFQIVDLNPSVQITFHNAKLTTNQWGFRDKEYELVPAPGAYRIALLGPSFVMGSGVADEEVFEWVLEDRLNREATGEEYDSFEILNFAVPGHSALQELYILETDALPFQTDAVFFVSHQLEKSVVARNLAQTLRTDVEIPYDYLIEVGERAGVTQGAPQSEAERLLRPYQTELVAWTYRQVVELAREHDQQAVWIFLPTFEGELVPEEVSELERLAQEAGFVTLNLYDVFDGANIADITVAEWDLHPNTAGHRLIADRLYQELIQNEIIP